MPKGRRINPNRLGLLNIFKDCASSKWLESTLKGF